MSYSSDIPEEIMEKIKEECEKISPKIRSHKFKCDYKNARLHNTINQAEVFGNKCTILEYIVALLDEKNNPLLDEGGKRDFIIVSIYVLEKDKKPYTHSDF